MQQKKNADETLTTLPMKEKSGFNHIIFFSKANRQFKFKIYIGYMAL